MRRFILSCILILSAFASFAQNKGFEKAVEVTGGIGLDKYQKFSFGAVGLDDFCDAAEHLRPLRALHLPEQELLQSRQP